MVSVLLSRLRQTRRVDGSGGDGGRDCYFSGEHGTDVYELKSFTGRMARAQRRQVKRSFARAMKTDPRTWTLVVPIDPTPGEQRWFDSLGAGLPAQVEWLGETWLEEQLAKFPDIVRYFSGAAEEVVRLLAEISREDALPDDAAGLAQQFAGQASRLNEIDPYYWFEFSIAAGAVTVTAHPRYPDAVRDRPITVTATLQFDDSPGQQEAREALAEFMKFGTPVTIPAASITGWPWTPRPAWAASSRAGRWPLTAPSRPGQNRRPRSCSASPRNRPSATWSAWTSPAAAPARPAGCVCSPGTGPGSSPWNSASTPSSRTFQAHLAYRYHADALPQDAVPVLRFCAAVAAGQEMAITDPAGNILATSSGAFGPADWPERYIRCAETLAEVQQADRDRLPAPGRVQRGGPAGHALRPRDPARRSRSRHSGAA